MVRPVIILLVGLLLAAETNGQAAKPVTTAESDLELYGWLGDLGAMARVEDGCNGMSDHAAESRAIVNLRREEAIRRALERKHGASGTVSEPEINAHPRCRTGPATHVWRNDYEATLSTLEQRLGLRPRIPNGS